MSTRRKSYSGPATGDPTPGFGGGRWHTGSPTGYGGKISHSSGRYVRMFDWVGGYPYEPENPPNLQNAWLYDSTGANIVTHLAGVSVPTPGAGTLNLLLQFDEAHGIALTDTVALLWLDWTGPNESPVGTTTILSYLTCFAIAGNDSAGRAYFNRSGLNTDATINGIQNQRVNQSWLAIERT